MFALLSHERCFMLSILVGLLTLSFAGCSVHGVWYHPNASVGHATSHECQAAGKDDEWKLEREKVVFYISPSYPVSVAPPGIAIIAIVPVGRVVKISVEDLRVYGSKGEALKGEIYLSALNNAGVHAIKEKLPTKTLALAGSKLANERSPKTSYYFGIRLQEMPSPSFFVLLPSMEVNGHIYPPLKIRFTKKPGQYFVMGINC